MSNVTEWMGSDRPTIIYGTGKQGELVYRFARIYGKRVLGFMTSGSRSRGATLPDEKRIPLFFPDSYEGNREEVDLVLSFGGGYKEVCTRLKEQGYKHIYYSDNWKEGNELIRHGKLTGKKFCIQMAEPQMDFSGDVRDRIIDMCCNMPNRPRIKFMNSPEETMNSFLGLRARCVSEYVLREADDSERLGFGCASCESLCKKDYLWHFSPFITYVNLTVYPSPCQCKCVYCSNEKYKWIDSPDVKEAYNDLFELLEYGKKSGLIWKHAVWQLSSGEITIHPYRDRFLELTKDRATAFFTNAFIFDKDIGNNLHENQNSFLKVSIDCGTEETWERIKGVHNYQKVKSNLEKYASSCYDANVQILLKYIILPGINDTEKDYQGFLNILKTINLKTFEIARDLRRKFVADSSETERLIHATAELVKLSKLHGIDPTMDLYSPWEEREVHQRAEN